MEEIEFLIGEKIINITPKPEKEMRDIYHETYEQYGNPDDVKFEDFGWRYPVYVSMAVAKYEGFKDKVYVSHQSGSIAWRAYINSAFLGDYTVYSDLVCHEYNSIDYMNYQRAKEVSK